MESIITKTYTILSDSLMNVQNKIMMNQIVNIRLDLQMWQWIDFKRSIQNTIGLTHFFWLATVVRGSCHSSYKKCDHDCVEITIGYGECRCKPFFKLDTDGKSCKGALSCWYLSS